eukprot:gene6524-7196_t
MITSAEHDFLVYNRAMAMFVKKAPFAKLFMIPGAYHEILCEQDAILQASLKVICDFFLQRSDDVHLVQPCYPLVQYDPSTPIYSLPELVMRGAGVALGVIGLAAGLAMIFTGERPSEILIIAGAGLLLYGPAKVKEQLRGSGVKGQIVSKGWIYDRKERIEEMKKYATKRRSQRALEFINQAIEEGDEEVLKKMEEFEDIFGQSDNNNEKTTTVVTKKK